METSVPELVALAAYSAILLLTLRCLGDCLGRWLPKSRIKPKLGLVVINHRVKGKSARNLERLNGLKNLDWQTLFLVDPSSIQL